MSFDRIDNNSYGGSPWQLPRRPLAISQQSADASTSNVGEKLLGFLGADRNGLQDNTSPQNKSWFDQWEHNAGVWSIREFAASAVNHVVTPTSSAGQAVDGVLKKFNTKAGQTSTTDIKPLPSTYSELFHLGREQVPLQKLSPSTYAQTVERNVKPFRDAIQSKNIGDFFKGVTPQSYLKDTVIDRNIRPIKDLVTNNPNKQVGTGIFQTAALGLMGYDVLKHTADAYKHAKAQEDGTLKSKLNTYKEATKAFGKYTVRDGASWESAGVGAAIGRALIPIALGGVSLGGIAVGAAVGLGAQKVLNHVLKTGEQDPINKNGAKK
jgi:hypothetical protein